MDSSQELTARQKANSTLWRSRTGWGRKIRIYGRFFVMTNILTSFSGKKTLLAYVASVAVLVGWTSVLAIERTNLELPPAADTQVDFQGQIEPILKDRCQSCHGAQQQLGGLRLDGREAALAGGYTGAVIVPGNSKESRLIHLIAGLKESDEDPVMPMVGDRLTTEEVGLFRAWIDQGAEWTAGASRAEKNDPQLKDSGKTHWAFIAPAKSPIPRVGDRQWVENPIDAFVLERLEEEDIDPSPEADPATLVRRLSLDLLGLPPTPRQVDEFLADTDPDAYGGLVDRLLDSPHYGEKWARQWLDLAHYGDSDGYENDRGRPHAWRWRHWVIEALNRNMPFDQFSIEQIAGDLLPNASTDQKVATGFFRNTLTNREGGMPLEQRRNEQVIDRTNTLGTVWLGLTVGCAQCHDHKYDPITQKDYYRLYAFFDSAQEANIEAPLPGELGPYLHSKQEYNRQRKELLDEYKVAPLYDQWEKKILETVDNLEAAELEWKVAWDTLGIDPDHAADGAQDLIRMPPAQRSQKVHDLLVDHMVQWSNLVTSEKRFKEIKFKELRKKLDGLKAEYPALSEAQTLRQNPNPPTTHLLIRGGWNSPGVEVQALPPAVLPPLRAVNGEAPRLSLAKWLVSRQNPLTARVTVNRIWQEFFGRGLLASSEDFGKRGSTPTHPRLLDWLAVEFMDNGWNVKAIQKLIVTSATYRQSSNIRDDLQEKDPDSTLLARQSRIRLTAESIRDTALAASGLLNRTIGGESVRPPMPKSVVELAFGMNDWVQWKESKGADRYRRGLYIFYQRTIPYPQLATFDAPDSLGACSRRVRSTTPLQALNLLNDPVFFEAARGLAARILREKQGSVADRLDYAFRLCLARKPLPHEKEYLIKHYREREEMLRQNPESVEALFAAEGVEGIDPAEAAVWVGLSSVLLNLDEFLTRG